MSFTALILDFDSLIWRCGFAAAGEPIQNALHSLKLQVEAIQDVVQCKLTAAYIKGNDNFRKALATSKPYKANRTQAPPENYEELCEYAAWKFGAIPAHGMEADDLCSEALYRAYNNGARETTVLAAMDKDLWNTPGWHYNYHPSKQRLEMISARQADMNFITQLLVGDASDNVPGLPRLIQPVFDLTANPEGFKHEAVGPKRAAKFLEGLAPREAMQAVYDAYIRYGMMLRGWTLSQSEEYLLEQGRLLWMTRELKQGKPVLWEIPGWLVS